MVLTVLLPSSVQFGSSFSVMDAQIYVGRTTQGVQAALSTALPRAVSIVLDLEGADSRDRVDPGFERRVSTFALALVDVLLLNTWYV